MKCEMISWARLHQDCRCLAEKLNALGPFSTLIAVTRGGLAPAAIIARELDIRVVETVGIRSYEEEMHRGAVSLIKALGDGIAMGPNAAILVIDDLADTGATAEALRMILPGATFAAPYVKPQGARFIDHFITQFPQDVWIYFPWDTDQDGLYSAPVTRKEGAGV
ncbi:MAG: xanthine phosphoribosyltransferase [Methylocystis sp.]